MIRSRSLASPGDLCCLPSPHRISQSVAGMAFNFSKVDLMPHASKRKPPVKATKSRGPADSGRAQEPISCFGLTQYSPAT
jgi:hypothetical protein